jgi:hypothetical protein
VVIGPGFGGLSFSHHDHRKTVSWRRKDHLDAV